MNAELQKEFVNKINPISAPYVCEKCAPDAEKIVSLKKKIAKKTWITSEIQTMTRLRY
jgi:hypothetical protein